MSKPALRSAARSAIVDLEPSRMTRSASPGSADPGHTLITSTSGSASSGSRSSKLETCGRIGTAILTFACFAVSRAFRRQSERILGRQAMGIGEERHQAERIPAGGRRDHRHAVGKQRGIAAELVDDEAAHHLGVVRVDHRPGADDAGDDAAAVDVADDDHGHISGARKTHIGDVVAASDWLPTRCRRPRRGSGRPRASAWQSCPALAASASP